MFLNASDGTEAEAEARRLLCAFFESGEARNIECFGSIHSVNDAVLKLSAHLGLHHPPGISVAEIIARVSENHGAVTFEKGGASMGVVFSVSDGPAARRHWTLCLSRGPMPMLDLRTNHGRTAQPQRQWGRALFERGAAHVVWLDGTYGIGRSTCYGDNDNQYLLWKRQELMAKGLSTAGSSKEAVQAGLELRQLCRSVHELELRNLNTAGILSSRPWKRRRLVEDFDRSLISRAGIGRLTTMLDTMGIDVGQWLAI